MRIANKYFQHIYRKSLSLKKIQKKKICYRYNCCILGFGVILSRTNIYILFQQIYKCIPTVYFNKKFP